MFAKHYAVLIIGRIIVGIGTGLVTVITPMYITEIAPPHIRGALGSATQLMINIGIIVSIAIALPLANIYWGYRWMLGIAAFPAILQLLGAIFICTDTPRYLMSKGRNSDAIQVLQRIYNRLDVDIEFQEMETCYNNSLQYGNTTFTEILSRPILRRCFLIAFGVMIFQQLTGINTVTYFSSSIFQAAGFKSATDAIIASTIVSLANIIVTCIAIYLVDRKGRKSLLLLSYIGMAFFIFWIGASFTFFRYAYWMPIFSVIVTILYVMSFGIGTGPLPWVIASEVLPLKIRGKALSIATAGNWVINFLVGQVFLPISRSIGIGGAFFIFFGFCVVAIFFGWFYVPETKGKSLEEIENSFQIE